MTASHDLAAGDIAAHIRRLAVPAAVGLFCQTLYNITDTFYAGWLGTEAQAGLSFAFPLYFVLLSCSVGLSQALTARVAKAVGAKRMARGCYFAGQGAMLAIVVGIMIWLLCTPSIQPALDVLGAKGEARKWAAEYIEIIFMMSPCFLLLFVFGGALQAVGNTTAYRNSVIGSALINIVLDPWFMFGWFGFPAMGVAGVALATVVSTGLSALYLLWVLSRTPLGLRWRKVFLRPRREKFGLLLWESITPTSRMLAIGAGFFITTSFLGVLDATAVAAYGIALRVEQLFLLPLIGMEVAMLAFAGQNLGAQKPQRVAEALRVCRRFGYAFTFFGALVLIFGGAILLNIFNNDPEVIKHGRHYLLVAAAAGPLYFLMNIGGAVLLAGRRPAPIFTASVVRLLIFPPLFYWFFALHLNWGVNGIWFGVWLAQTAPTWFLYRQSMRLLAECQKQTQPQPKTKTDTPAETPEYPPPLPDPAADMTTVPPPTTVNR